MYLLKHKGWDKIGLLLVSMMLSLLSIAQEQNFDPEALLKEGAAPGKLVNDYTGNTLTAEQIATLERKLVALDDSTFTQITVVIAITTVTAVVVIVATAIPATMRWRPPLAAQTPHPN